MALASRQQLHVVYRMVFVGHNSAGQVIHLTDDKYVSVGVKNTRPNKWVVFIYSHGANANGSRISEVRYSINYGIYQPTCFRWNGTTAVFRTQELEHSDEDHPECTIPIEFSFALQDTIGNYSLQRIDNKMAMDLWSSAVNREYTDVEVVVGDRIFWAHKAILAARSPVLAATLRNEKCSTGTIRIQVIGFTSATFETLLKFIYTGAVHGSIDNQLSKAASFYRIETLMQICHSSA